MTADERGARLAALWASVDGLLARATLPGILAHKLGPLAAHRLRKTGEPLPEALILSERAASVAMMTVRPLLDRVRSSCDGPLVLIKGAELALLYPGQSRRFGDLDLLVPDAESTQRSLLASGFVESTAGFDAPAEDHHLTPLQWPSIPLKIEVHFTQHWPLHAPRPAMEEIIDASVPTALGIDGLSTPAPHHHALILAAHGWRHEPLWTLRDLVDIAAVSAYADAEQLRRTSQAWRVDRIWRTTEDAIEALFYGGRRTVPLRTWARHLELVRDRNGFEKQLTRLLEGYWGMPLQRAPVQMLRGFRDVVGPIEGESWSDKLVRVPRALRNLRAPVGQRGDPPDRPGRADS